MGFVLGAVGIAFMGVVAVLGTSFRFGSRSSEEWIVVERPCCRKTETS
ncbi:hypothetical protein KC19_12G058500 [Ceratodon purpureus]|uniref:Uncharacterized protein n=1 Tax=Ceratodon purpureus TaxID=3225 RepID=A0A8T0G422_CERPU|nr:hypothetical protein KC19_12G058500 [Ceratodon purpureus]